MRRGATTVLGTLLLFAGSATAPAALPEKGVFVAGRSLGGLALGVTPRAVRKAWGRSFGVCRSCLDRTWYFNYTAFQPQGAAVSFRAGRVAGLFTLWQPAGWRSTDGLRLGDPAARIVRRYPHAAQTICGGYYAQTVGTGATRTDFYVVNGKLWGFGLRRPSVPPCR